MKLNRVIPIVYLPALGLVAMGAVSVAALTIPVTRGVRIPIERASIAASDARDDRSRPGGAAPDSEWPADIELVPDALLVSDQGRESVEYHAEITVVRGANVGVSWTADTLDDPGNIVHSALTKGAERAAKDSIEITGPIRADLSYRGLVHSFTWRAR